MDEKNERFDPQVLLRLTKGNQAVFAAVVSEFRTQCPSILADMESSVTAGDWPQVLFHAHAVKGMFRQLGATQLQKLTIEMEQLAQENADPAKLAALSDSIRQEYGELCQLLNSYS